jgi:PAS domain S-box-containing protein
MNRTPSMGSQPFFVHDSDYKMLVESVVDYAIFMLDSHGYIVTWSRGAERINGWSADEIIGRHFSTFYPQEDLDRGKPTWELKVAAEVGRFEDEDWRIRKDGSRFWANVVITALYDPSGELRGFAKVTRDLTERRKAAETAIELAREQTARALAEASEAQLRESHGREQALARRLEIILQGVADGITVQDRSGRLMYANDAAARLCGFPSAAGLLATPTQEIIERFEMLDESGAPLDPEMLPGRQALRGANPQPMLLLVREKSTGREWWSRIRSRAVLDDAGRPELAINIWHDVTAEHRERSTLSFLVQATSTLSESLDPERTLRSLADLLVPELADWCVIDLFERGAIRSVAIAHRDPERIALARALRERYPPDLDAPMGVPQVIRTGRSELYRQIPDEMLAATARDEEHLALVRQLQLRSVLVVPLSDRGRIFGAMSLVWAESAGSYDEGDLALAEELGRRAGIAIENARLYQEAQAAIARRDEFFSVASHELRTPLMTLEMHLTALLKYATDGRLFELSNETVIERLQKTRNQSLRLTQLVTELLDVSRITGGRILLEREQLDLVELSREIVDRFEAAAVQAGSSLELIAHRPIVGAWDRGRVEQVLTNLVENALKYGGRNPVTIELSHESPWARVSVHDRGIGIRPEDQSRIFERFERTDAARNYGGLGLGLWIVRQICEAHGGRVEVSSRPNEGSTFTVHLPIHPPDQSAQ